MVEHIYPHEQTRLDGREWLMAMEPLPFERPLQLRKAAPAERHHEVH
ncbi:hypothetical protein PSQ19_05125 [Devosia algicola]|uniref:Uncharacterized protein n=1 Tax=Devosia algicola TaxID=3026418 RepID=A0ABY7YQF3_9HYPH|nr:hypothetical protein [Devosia algicola]WDR03484.1 hypothetical protein PSQ19_05125 [Devosia algicola]